MSELSPFEVTLLNDIVERHLSFNDYDLTDLTHQFAEVKGQRPSENTSIPLELEEVVRAACRAEYQDEIIEDLQERLRKMRPWAESPSVFAEGDAYRYTHHRMDTHPWVILSPLLEGGEHILVANFTKWRQWKDQTCIVDPSERLEFSP